MGKYLTPQQYRTKSGGFATPTSTNWQDWQLEELINRAETAVDSYMDFNLRFPSGFAPALIGLVPEKFDFSTRKLQLPMPPVPARNVQRIRLHISNIGSSLPYSNQSVTAQGLFATFDPGEVVLNQDDGYGELIALTLTYSLASIVWELGLDPPIMEWDLECGFYLPYYGRTLYNISGDLLTYRALRGFWASTYTQAPSILPNQLPSVPPLLYKNGVQVNATLLTAPLAAGTAYTQLAVAPLPQAAGSGATFTLNASAGLTPASVVPALAVTLSAPALAGATTLHINSVTPLVTYPAAAIPSWYNTNATQQNLPWSGYLNGTYLTQGCALDYTEGTVSFYNTGTPSAPVANASTDLIQADFTSTIPDLAMEATTEQVTYLITQSNLNQIGMGGLELLRNGNQQARRSKSDDVQEDQLCARARLKLASYHPIAVAGG